MNKIMKFLKGLFYMPDNIESNVEWTGPSVRVKDGEALLNSEELKRDLEAVEKLMESRRNNEL
jgi:hypothetical protein